MLLFRSKLEIVISFKDKSLIRFICLFICLFIFKNRSDGK